MADDLSWEEIVNRVTISSNYFMVDISADRWVVAFQRIEKLADAVRELAKKSQASWKGAGANAFYDHLEKIAKALDETTRQHRSVVPRMRLCAEHLRNAVTSIPIPNWMIDEVKSKQTGYCQSGIVDVVQQNKFRRFEYEGYRYNWTEAELDKYWYEPHHKQALQAYNTLCKNYQEDAAAIPPGTKVSVPGVASGSRNSTSAGPGKTPSGLKNTSASTLPGSTAGLGMPSTSMPSTGIPAAGLTTPTLATPDMPVSGMPTMPELSDPTSGGLAGVGALDKLAKGLGGGGGGGVGVPDLGPTASLPAGAMTGVGAGPDAIGMRGRAAVSGVGGVNPQAAGSTMGMAPGSGGAGAPVEGAATGTELTEQDKQMFGRQDQDLPGGVLD